MNYLDLPVYKHKNLILDALAKSQVIVVESPTGSGKTTQLPIILYQAGYAKTGAIGVTQPRRIASLSVSEFIAAQMETRLGGIVGYKMRFEDKTEPGTKIKIMTDGILLQEMKLDPWLSRYDCLIIDEAHERSLNIDFILGLIKRILEDRTEFKLIISSATINASVFSEYFGQCPVVKIDSQSYPVTLIYDPVINKSPKDNSASAEALLNKIADIIERQVTEDNDNPGDILVFLPGEKIIKDCMQMLVFSSFGSKLHVIPLYGRLGKEEQEKVFYPAPEGKIKVIVSTNIAETSVTINGISMVIDSGLSKLNHYNPRTYTSSLIEAPISKASSNQRRGRAGRTREGTCYRLYTRKDFENRPLFTTEEIYRTDLSEVVLRMADLGIQSNDGFNGISSYEEFDFISPPGREGLLAAIETLKLLDALENDLTLSNTGKLMTQFPLSPRHSRIITEAVNNYPDVLYETTIAAAFLSTQSPYILPPGEETDARRAHHRFRDKDGDFVSYLKLYDAYLNSPGKLNFCEKNFIDEKEMAEIHNVTVQLGMILSDLKIPVLSGGSMEDYLASIAKGLVQFICVREGRELYHSLTADKILIHPGSVMFRENPDFIVAGEIVKTSRMYAMSVSPISYKILERLNPLLASELNRVRPKEKTSKPRLIQSSINQLKIEGELFNIETYKGKKIAVIPWEKLKPLINNINPGKMVFVKGLKGVITVNDSYFLLRGEKIKFILELVKTLDVDGFLKSKLKSGSNFNSSDNLDSLIKILPNLLKPAVWKKSEKQFRGKQGNSMGKRELGFFGLITDGEGNYRTKCSRGFHTSLNESIFSIETLIDEMKDDVDAEKKNIVNQCYRRLMEYISK